MGVIASAVKIVPDGRLFPAGLSFDIDALFPTAFPGDGLAVLAWSRVSPTQLSTDKVFTSYVPDATGKPQAATTGTVFNETGDAVIRKSPATFFALAKDYVAAETIGFSAVRPDTNGAGETCVLIILVRGKASNPFGTLPYSNTGNASATYTIPAQGGLVPLMDTVRVAWFALTSATTETATFATGPRWSDETGVSTVNAFGARSRQYLMVTGYTGQADGSGNIAGEQVALGPVGFNTIAASTLVLQDEGPANPPARRPSVSGSVQGTKTVTGKTGTWFGETPMTPTYQWQHDTAGDGVAIDISAATASTYTIDDALAGSRLRVKVTMTGPGSAGSATAFSDWTTAIVPGSAPQPTGTPTFTGNGNTGLGLPDEVLAADVTGVSWTGSPTRLVEWGRSADASMASAVIVASGSTFAIPTSSAFTGMWLAVRERDTVGGSTTAWSASIKVTRPLNVATDIRYCAAIVNDAGKLIPGPDVSTATSFPVLITTHPGQSHSIAFVQNLHPDIEAPLEVAILTDPVNPHLTVQFAAPVAAANTPVDPFAVGTGPTISGSYSHPDADTPLAIGTAAPRGGYVPVARRETLASGADKSPGDACDWRAYITITGP